MSVEEYEDKVIGGGPRGRERSVSALNKASVGRSENQAKTRRRGEDYMRVPECVD